MDPQGNPVKNLNATVEVSNKPSPLFSIEAVRARIDPARTYKFEVFLPSSSGINISTFVEDVRFSLQDFSVKPYQSSAQLFKFAGETVASDVVITFYEGEDYFMSKYLQGWRNSIRNADGTYNYPRTYKSKIIVHLLDGRNKKVAQVNCLNCWPQSALQMGYSYYESGRVTVSQSFACDNIELVYFETTENNKDIKLIRPILQL